MRKNIYIIAEIGINHNGSMDTCKELIKVAKDSGCNAVKFQKRTPEVSVPNNQKNVLRETPWGQLTYLEYKKKIELNENDFEYIDDYCKSKNIDWFCSCWDIQSLKFIKKFNPNCHVIKLGTMGEYGTPNIDIEEGWLDVSHKKRKQKFLYPRQASSLYHTSKIMDTDLLWFYVRLYGLRVTDLMQGPVYGLKANDTINNEELYPEFTYDDLFGTVLNRFIVQSLINNPLTIYGSGKQIRGYINIKDSVECIKITLQNKHLMNSTHECLSQALCEALGPTLATDEPGRAL